MENGEKKTVSRTVIDREVIMRKYHVHIKNFRNLKDVKVTLSPLTILTGENGSGKSTFFKALLFLKHNHTHEAAKKLKYVIDDDINLGGWYQIANDPKKPISIKITEETWGYDHQVEEVYDIDNCPFELNPTEERYAIWKNIREEKYNLSQDINNSNRKICEKITTKKSSSEYLFVDGLLSYIEVDSNQKWKFIIEFLHRPFPDWIDPLYNNKLYLDNTESLARLSRIRNSDSDIPVDLFSSLCGMTYSRLLFDKDIYFDKHEIPNCIIDVDNLELRSNFLVDLPYYAFEYSNELREFSKVHQYNELLEISGSIFGFKATHNLNFFFNMFSVGTVREIPKSRYLNEYINEKTYYGMFTDLDKMSKLGDSGDYGKAMQWSYIVKTLNHWINEFEFGESISIFSKMEVSTIALKIHGNKLIKLSEASSGALQLIPVLYFLTTNLSSSSIFLIQQPELHLHPMMQSKVVDFVLDRLNPNFDSLVLPQKFDWDQRWKTGYLKDQISSFLENWSIPKFIVLETHSEHIVKKLQVLVSRGTRISSMDWRYLESGPEVIDPRSISLKDALSIYYFAKDAKGNTCATELELDDNGFFKTETPKGFFDESLDLNRQLLLGRN